MSTRSLICIQREKGKYDAIYCHSDGYLTYNGAMLYDHYKDREKVEKLINLGNISLLAEKVDPDPSKPHSFDYNQRQEGVTVAYGRDRGEKDQETQRNISFEKLKEWPWIEYIYIYNLNNEWQYISYPEKEDEEDSLKFVKEDLDKEYESLGIKRPKNFYGFWTEESLKQEKKRQEEGEM